MNDLPQTHVEKISLWKVFVDPVIVALSLSSTPIITKYIKPFHRGFFCNDGTLRYPYKSSTVGMKELYLPSTLIPVLTISAMELWLQRSEKHRRRTVLVGWWAVPEWVVRGVRHILLFGLVLGCIETVLNIGKFTAGRLRPHFMAACKPSVLCNATDAYITDYQCTGESRFAIFQCRLSFPSGHSSVAFYAAVFTVMYLENRVRWPERAIVAKTAYEILVMLMAWFTALSRIPDYKHHGTDVFAGGLLGALGAWFCVMFMLRVRPDSDGSSGNGNSSGSGNSAATAYVCASEINGEVRGLLYTNKT